jgi:TolA-binding protein
MRAILALSLSLLTAGCVYFQKPPLPPLVAEPNQTLASLNRAQDLFQKGDYGSAIKAYRYVVETYPQDSLAAEAQFGLAYTLLYFENPKRDYGEALKEFQRFTERYTISPRLREAKNWVSFLNQLNDQAVENERLKSDLQRLLDIDIESEKKRKEGK